MTPSALAVRTRGLSPHREPTRPGPFAGQSADDGTPNAACLSMREQLADTQRADLRPAHREPKARTNRPTWPPVPRLRPTPCRTVRVAASGPPDPGRSRPLGVLVATGATR